MSEITMTNESPKPSPSDDFRLLGNLRCAWLAMEEIGPQLDELITRFDEEIRQQRSRRTQKSIHIAESKISSEI
jgi:hypothetical protein